MATQNSLLLKYLSGCWLAVFFSVPANGQLLMGADFLSPTHDLQFVAGSGLSVHANYYFRDERRVRPWLEVSADRFGKVTQFSVTDRVVTFPLQAGLRVYPFTRRMKRLFIEGGAGVVWLYFRMVNDNFYYTQRHAETSANLGYRGAIGIQGRLLEIAFARQYFDSSERTFVGPANYNEFRVSYRIRRLPFTRRKVTP